MYLSKKLTYHLYLENVEVDFTSIQILEQAGAPPTAVVSIAPVTGIYNVLPKTIAVITCDIEKRHPVSGKLLFEADGSKLYEEVVIFFGELNGYGLSRTPDSADVQLSFNGFTQNWTTAPVVPTQASIPTLSEAVLLGVNYFEPTAVNERGQPTQAAYKTHGFIYNQFPSVLLTLASLLPTRDEVTGAIKEPDLTDFPFLSNIDITADRPQIRKALVAYKDKLALSKPSIYKEVKELELKIDAKRITNLQKPFTFFLKHFLLNYGVYLASTTKSILLDAMITYIGSAEGERALSTIGTVEYLKEGLKESATTTVMDVVQRVFPALRYDLFEYAAPIKTLDSLGANAATLSKIIIKPRSEMLSPIANNVLFDDNIITAQYSRNLITEPTRLLAVSNPTLVHNPDNIPTLQTALATIVPHNVIMKDVLQTMSKNTQTQAEQIDKAATAAQGLHGTDIASNLTAVTAGLDYSSLGADDLAYINLLNDIVGARDLKQQKNLNDPGKTILRLTSEEYMRGVVTLVKQDEAKFEQAYLLALINEKTQAARTGKQLNPFLTLTSWQNNPDFNKTIVTTTDFTQSLNKGSSGDTKKNNTAKSSALTEKQVLSYYADMSHYHYLDMRRRSRVLNITTDYSPHRVCGFPGLIILKDIGPVVGYLQAITTMINAGGEAKQSLAFSHVSIINTLRKLDTATDYHDHYSDILPPYLREFTVDKVGKNLYNYASGRSDASVYDFCQTNKMTVNSTLDCAQELQKKYEGTSNLEEREQFLHKLTWRNLVSMGEFMTVMSNSTEGHKPRVVRFAVTDKNNPRPFIDIRQEAILEIFKPVKPNIGVWKDK